MNCEPGDLAIIVRSLSGLEGKLVRCTEWLGDREGNGVWAVKVLTRPGRAVTGEVSDSLLRPLRTTDGEDETLKWAGKPRKLAK